MKKRILNGALAAVLCASMLTSTGCIGSFSLSNRLLGWNKTVGNKFLNELVFFAFWVLPVYEVTGLADLLVLNSIEFWSGRNPMGDHASTTVENSKGEQMEIIADATGYDIRNTTTGKSYRLEHDAADDSWGVVADGERHVIFAWVDETHVSMPVDANGNFRTFETSATGLYAYSSIER